MIDISRLGLGCMGMHMGNKDRAVDTVHAALDMGIKLFNTGEFYCGGASEMVLGEALKGVPRDKYFVSVKFGMLWISFPGTCTRPLTRMPRTWINCGSFRRSLLKTK